MARSSWNHYARDNACPASRHGAVELLKMRCCFVAEMAHALLVLLIIRLLFIITELQMALLVCLVPALALELLFALLLRCRDAAV